MKLLYTFIFLLILYPAFSQPINSSNNFDTLMKYGKAEFVKEYEKRDYAAAIVNLEKAVKLKPNSAEAHYFLGYAYCRVNTKDANEMTNENLPNTMKISEQFEIVNKLQEKYKGEIVNLDPYSKLSSEWGSLSMNFWHSNKDDSLIWALKEGKKRGGFGEFFLAYYRAVLDRCSTNAILISSGDQPTFSLLYLQNIENYRKDVAVVDIGLLGTTWYPSHLTSKNIVGFDLPKNILDTIEYCEWKDSSITINNFTWIVKSNYQENYILRNGRVFLSLLKENNFKRDVYFTKGFMTSESIGLSESLLSLIFLDKVNTKNEPELDFIQYKSAITKLLSLVKLIDTNSSDQLRNVDGIRVEILARISSENENKNKKQALELLKLLYTYANEKTYPYQYEGFKKYIDSIVEKL